MRCIGHRGAAGRAPENTLLSFARAIEMGADWIELDVQCCDDQLVVVHDQTVDRTTNGSGPVSGFSYGELRELDAGQGEQIPTLSEVLELVNARIGVNVELKGKGTAAPVVSLLQSWVSRPGWSMDQFLISSFSHDMLRETRARNPAVPLGALFADRSIFRVHRTVRLGAQALNPPLARVTDWLVERAHYRGLQVFVYTVDAADDIQRMLDMGVDGVFTNFPDLGRAIIDAQTAPE